MYKLLPTLLCLIACLACQKQEIATDCEVIADCEILSESKKDTTCIYSEVYHYEGEIYTIYNCCVCDVIYMAIDCNGGWLCEIEEDCMERFSSKAKYLYSVVKD